MPEQLSYEETCSAIREAAKSINIDEFNINEHDGRIASAVIEKLFLDLLSLKLKDTYPSIDTQRPKARDWFDIRINGIHIDLKISAGNTDNAFNKRAIAATLAQGKPCVGQNTNFTELYKKTKPYFKNNTRNRVTEYHYLVIHKERINSVLLKSILDIHTYKTNPSNTLQINWDLEFDNTEYKTSDDDIKAKKMSIIKTMQKSVQQKLALSKDFADADIDRDFSDIVQEDIITNMANIKLE